MKSLCAMGYAANDRRQGGYAVASRVKSLSNGFHGDPLVVEAARPWAIAFTRQYHWPIAIADYLAKAYPDLFESLPDTYSHDAIALGIRKGNPDFLRWLDMFTSIYVSSGKYAETYGKWWGGEPPVLNPVW